MQLENALTTFAVVLLVASAVGPASGAVGVQSAELSTQSISGTEEATVIEVTDGDTIEIEYDNGTQETVRLLGVDTPEVHTENDPAEFEGVPETSDGETCLYYEGKVASSIATNRLLGERVTLKYDSEADRRGYYGRLIAYVYIDGENFNYQLIDHGHARVYDSTFSKSDEFYAAEDDAQNADIGVWECTNPSSQLGSVTIERIYPDPEGNDNYNLNDEYVIFQNRQSSATDLSGWEIQDAAGYDYTVPSGFDLESGETATLHTGTGSDSANHLYWDLGSAVWNNDGDTGYLYDAYDALVDSKSY